MTLALCGQQLSRAACEEIVNTHELLIIALLDFYSLLSDHW